MRAPSRASTDTARFFRLMNSAINSSCMLVFNQRTAARTRGENSPLGSMWDGTVDARRSRSKAHAFSVAFRS